MLCDEKALQGYMWIENENKVDDVIGEYIHVSEILVGLSMRSDV